MSALNTITLGLTPPDAEALLRLAERYPEQLPPERRVAIRAALLAAAKLGADR